MAVVEPGELETFLVLADELHFGRTAQRRQVSPQRVSQLIQALERRIGGALFERTSRHVALTGLGRQFRDHLQPHYQGIQDALACATATAHGVTCHLRIGVFSTLWAKVIVEVADVLRARRSPIELLAHEISAGDAFEPLIRGEVDVMNASLPVQEQGITAGPVLLEEPRVLAISARHPLARQDGICQEDLARTPLLVAPYMSSYWNEDRSPTLTPKGRPIPRGPHISSVSEGLALIAAGKGGFCFGAHTARYNPFPGVAFVPIHDALPVRWALVRHAGARVPLLRDLTEAVRTVLADGGCA